MPHTVQLLQRICDEAQRGLDQEGALPQKAGIQLGLGVTWRFMGSYKWSYKSPNMGYNYS